MGLNNLIKEKFTGHFWLEIFIFGVIIYIKIELGFWRGLGDLLKGPNLVQ